MITLDKDRISVVHKPKAEFLPVVGNQGVDSQIYAQDTFNPGSQLCCTVFMIPFKPKWLSHSSLAIQNCGLGSAWDKIFVKMFLAKTFNNSGSLQFTGIKSSRC